MSEVTGVGVTDELPGAGRRAFSGRDAGELTLDRLAGGELGPDDVRIHPDTLLEQAEVLALYEALRPRRATAAELESLAARLDAVPAPRCAALVREASAVYARRNLLAATTVVDQRTER